MAPKTISWSEGGLCIIDQTRLPLEVPVIRLETVQDVWEAIKELKIRGAPAIGVCAAFGVVVALREKAPGDVPKMMAVVKEAADFLATSRPTAVNLFWALDRMKRVAVEAAESGDADALYGCLETEAIEILEEDTRLCRAIGENGAELIHEGDGVLTHCNAGALATSAYGTALSPMFVAHERGVAFKAYADETRPLLQGARLTMWELMQAGIDVTLICDNTAAQVMREGKIQLVIVGADRVAANGDAANKIGTYNVALIARAHDIPFYVAAPLSTFDAALDHGDLIPIEQRDPTEVTHGFGQQTAPDGARVYSPAFDVTPADLIAGIVTERGILRPPYKDSVGPLLRVQPPEARV